MSSVDPKAIVLCTIFPILAILAVIARFWAKSIQKENGAKLGGDDWWILPALLFSIGNAINVLYGAINADLGQHMPLDKEGFAQLGPKVLALEKMTYASQPLVTSAITCARFSILLFYVRIFITRPFRITAYVVCAINLAWGIAFTLVYLFQCTPVAGFWTQVQGKRTARCVDISVNLPYAVMTILIDMMVLTLPWPMVWRLKMKLAQKIAVISIFMLGAIVTGVSIGKCHTFFTVGAELKKYHDLTYSEAPLFYWTVPECCLSVVCACLPTLRPIFRGMSPESLIGSIRSVISLSSLRGENKGGSTAQTRGSELGDRLNGETGLRQKTSAEHSVDIEIGRVEDSPDVIRTTKRFEIKVEERT